MKYKYIEQSSVTDLYPKSNGQRMPVQSRLKINEIKKPVFDSIK